MRRYLRRPASAWVACLVLLGVALAQSPAAPQPASTPTLYVVPYAHLDTQWRWDYVRTIGEYIPNTMRQNFALFEKYPHYVFNFSGSNRYRMMKEYYPADYAKVKAYVAAGRWFPSGSSVEESDVNTPSAESLVRQVLYGKQFFRRELGKTSAEYMLPDCFGFPASLPTILAHTGIKGFSTQKLTWKSAAPVGGPGSPERTPVGIPFNVGVWTGPDGRGVIAAFNPMSYGGDVRHDLSKSPPPAPPDARQAPVDWPERVRRNGEVGGLFADYHYYGTGDIGGSPREPSVRLMEAILARGRTVLPSPSAGPRFSPQEPPPSGPEVQVGDGPLRVVQATAEQMFLDITPEQAAKLPRYEGDLLLTDHSAGSLTSQAYMKRWNRKNELLADAAERASVAAEWLGGRLYPLARLNDAWTLVMGGQFHDILPGTSIPKAYEYSWNDEVLALNQFAGVLTNATAAVASGLDTRTTGTAVVVYNPLNVAREDVVEATLAFAGGAPTAVRVVGPEGRPVPAQLGAGGTVVFLARVPSVGYAVYDVQPAEAPAETTLKATESSIENDRYVVRLDGNGDISSILDKTVGKELLSAPARLALQFERPRDYPAWNMDWRDQQGPPRGHVLGPAKVRVVESGPARVSLEVDRETEGSRFVQTIRLAAGDAGNRVEVASAIDWKIGDTALKATFPLTASNPEATYSWDVGTVRRGNNDPRKYEVPSHQWFDLTDRSGSHGVTVLSDCKYGSDKPADDTLRLTLIYSPGIGEGNSRGYSDQATQDWGHHELVYGLAGHAGDFRRDETDWQAHRLNQPLVAFESPRHPGPLGRTFSLLGTSTSRVRVLALKKAEQGDEYVVRVVELDGRKAPGVRLTFASPVAAAREVNGAEEPVGPATVARGELVTDLGPFQLRSFAVKLAPSRARVAAPRSREVPLPHDRSVASLDGTRSGGGFDAAGRSLPAEMLPGRITFGGISFSLAPAGAAKPDATVARGQVIPLPAGRHRRVHLLAASAEGDQKVTLRVGDTPVDLVIQDWGGYVGQWDNRTWATHEEPAPPRPGMPAPRPGTPPRMRTLLDYRGLVPGYVKRAPVAWFASHRHTAEGANEPYSYAYLYDHAVEVPDLVRTLTLPENDKVRVLAVTVAEEGEPLRPAQPLYDTLPR